MIDSELRPATRSAAAPAFGRTRFEIATLLLIVVAGALPFLLRVSADPDLWWHVRAGETIIDEGSMPRVDDWSFTAAGSTWTNHEWLTDVIFAGSFDVGGGNGLLLVRNMLFVIMVAGLVVAYAGRVREPIVVLLMVLVTVPILGTFINVRAHSFSYALLVWSVVAIDRVRSGNLRWLAALPLMMAFWVNLHGGFLLGLGFIGLSLFLMLAGWDGGYRLEGLEKRLVIGTGLATLAVTMLNPHGVGLFSYLASELGANHSIVSEWQPPSGNQLAYFWIYLLVPLGLWVLARQWRQLGLVSMLVVTALGTFRHARFFVLMGLFGSLLAAGAAGAIMRRARDSGRFVTTPLVLEPKPAFAGVIVLIALLAVPLYGGLSRGEGGVTVDTSLYPIEATAWLKERELGPNLAVPLAYGGYSIWHLGPEVKVSVDGRNLTVYDDAWVDRYLRALRDGTALEVLDENTVDVWLLPADSPQIPALVATGRWSVAYVDPVAAVVVPGLVDVPVAGPPPPSSAQFP